MLKNYYGTKFSQSYHIISQREYIILWITKIRICHLLHQKYTLHIPTEIISRSIQFIFVLKKKSMVKKESETFK